MKTFRCFKCDGDSAGACTLTMDETCNVPEQCPFPDSSGEWIAEWAEDTEEPGPIQLTRHELRMICYGLSWQIAIAASYPGPDTAERRERIRAWGELRDRLLPDGWRVRCRACGKSYGQQTTNAPTRCGACGSTDVEVD